MEVGLGQFTARFKSTGATGVRLIAAIMVTGLTITACKHYEIVIIASHRGYAGPMRVQFHIPVDGMVSGLLRTLQQSAAGGVDDIVVGLEGKIR